MIWLTDDAECQQLSLRAMHCSTNTGFINAFSGKAAGDILGLWGKVLQTHRP